MGIVGGSGVWTFGKVSFSDDQDFDVLIPMDGSQSHCLGMEGGWGGRIGTFV